MIIIIIINRVFVFQNYFLHRFQNWISCMHAFLAYVQCTCNLISAWHASTHLPMFLGNSFRYFGINLMEFSIQHIYARTTFMEYGFSNNWRKKISMDWWPQLANTGYYAIFRAWNRKMRWTSPKMHSEFIDGLFFFKFIENIFFFGFRWKEFFIFHFVFLLNTVRQIISIFEHLCISWIVNR